MAIMVSIPAGVIANQQTSSAMASNLSNVISQTSDTINKTATQIDCSLASDLSGFGFAPPDNAGGGGHSVEGSPPAGFDPSQFGGGGTAGQFGGGAFGGGQANPNE